MVSTNELIVVDELKFESNYHKILKQNLGNLNDYEYMGGFTNKYNNEKNNYMIIMENEGAIYPELKWFCECSHWIKQNCYVRNMKTLIIYTVGNCCINYFGIKKKCNNCNEVHKRTKHIICFKCEQESKEKIKELKLQQKELTKLENELITFGKYKNRTIGYVYNTDINYFNWCIKKNDDNYSKIFKDIIRYNKLIML